MRLIALCELPGEWTATVARWNGLNAPLIADRRQFARASATLNICSTRPCWRLASDLPPMIFAARPGLRREGGARGQARDQLAQSCTKAMNARSALYRTDLIRPDIRRISGVAGRPLHGRVARPGTLNSLYKLTLKPMMPGVPDFYQGTEFWDLSMVDPTIAGLSISPRAPLS